MNVRFSTLFFILLFMVAALGLYGVKYKVQTIREQVADATQHLKDEREALHVTRAEWTYLSRPQRLKELSHKHLKLAPIAGGQMAELTMLPLASSPNQGLAMAEPAAGATAAVKPVSAPARHASPLYTPASAEVTSPPQGGTDDEQ